MPDPSNNPPPADLKTETAGTVPPVSLVTPAEIVEPMGSRMPSVTEGVTSTTPPAETSKPAPVIDQRDRRGEKFSPTRHKVDANGRPVVNAKGNFIRSEEYRKRYDSLTGKPKEPTGSAQTATTDKPAPSFNSPDKVSIKTETPLQDEYDAAAEIYLQSAYGPTIIAFSEEARPDAEQHAALKTAVANYLRVKQITEPSPGWSLLFVITAVAVKKSESPVVRERAANLFTRVKGWFNPNKK